MTIDTHGKALSTGTQSFQEQAGFKIHTNTACKLTKVTKVTAHTGVKAYLYNSSHSALASASYSGNDATFNYDLADNTDYYLLSGYDDATAHNEAYDLASGGYPYNATNINFVNRYTPSAGDTTNLVENIISVTTTTGPDFSGVKVNIGDTWKQVTDMKINIGDTWKDITEVKVNIADSWKVVV